MKTVTYTGEERGRWNHLVGTFLRNEPREVDDELAEKLLRLPGFVEGSGKAKRNPKGKE